ncbi:hypothetical protein EJ08DRAFT_679141 [Tothia fuscella]|uniref:Uncharacterized protein n=1 Tax=Tothia fuscella TaxID=1048955 RepID=A0A9P4NRX7_9PEZI|nr:hypothetical protein EJ08DRAFT_679141 [Tothia fuscella]
MIVSVEWNGDHNKTPFHSLLPILSICYQCSTMSQSLRKCLLGRSSQRGVVRTTTKNEHPHPIIEGLDDPEYESDEEYSDPVILFGILDSRYPTLDTGVSFANTSTRDLLATFIYRCDPDEIRSFLKGNDFYFACQTVVPVTVACEETEFDCLKIIREGTSLKFGVTRPDGAWFQSATFTIKDHEAQDWKPLVAHINSHGFEMKLKQDSGLNLTSFAKEILDCMFEMKPKGHHVEYTNYQDHAFAQCIQVPHPQVLRLDLLVGANTNAGPALRPLFQVLDPTTYETVIHASRPSFNIKDAIATVLYKCKARFLPHFFEHPEHAFGLVFSNRWVQQIAIRRRKDIVMFGHMRGTDISAQDNMVHFQIMESGDWKPLFVTGLTGIAKEGMVRCDDPKKVEGNARIVASFCLHHKIWDWDFSHASGTYGLVQVHRNGEPEFKLHET